MTMLKLRSSVVFRGQGMMAKTNREAVDLPLRSSTSKASIDHLGPRMTAVDGLRVVNGRAARKREAVWPRCASSSSTRLTQDFFCGSALVVPHRHSPQSRPSFNNRRARRNRRFDAAATRAGWKVRVRCG